MERNQNPITNPNIDSEIHPDDGEPITSKITLLYLVKNFYWLWIKPNKFFNYVNAKLTSFAVVLCVGHVRLLFLVLVSAGNTVTSRYHPDGVVKRTWCFFR